MALHVPLFTVDGLERFPDDGNRYELLDGVLLVTPVYDREFKRDAYFALGVQQVWLVDCHNALVEVSHEPGAFRRVRDVLGWRTPVDVPVALKLDEVFAGL